MSQQPMRPIIDPRTGLPIPGTGFPGDPGIDPTMGMGTPPPAAQPGFMSKIQSALGGPQGMMNMGASLLAGSGPSPVRQNLGSILGQSLLQNQQFQQQSSDSELKKMLLMSQIERNKRGTTTKTPSKVQEYEYAKQNGFEGSFQEWMRVGSAQQSPPSAVQEYEYYDKLPDQQAKDTYLTIKRSMQPFQLGEVGGGKVVFNRATGQYEQASSVEQEAAGAGQLASGTAAGKATGEAVATAKLDLPRLEQNTTQALQTIDQLKKHPGLPYITGLYSAAPIVPGTPQAGADALAKQIQGKTFLEAFTTLKGGGAITEIEGGKAEAAIARLQRSQNRREYIQALTELEGVMNVGLERARKKAGGNAQPRSREDILKQYGVQ
jgi:hypothetical protein